MQPCIAVLSDGVQVVDHDLWLLVIGWVMADLAREDVGVEGHQEYE